MRDGPIAGSVQVRLITEHKTADAKGLYITLNAGGSSAGENLVSCPVTLGGMALFNTNQSPYGDDPCADTPGVARYDQVELEDGDATTENNSEEGMQTSDRYDKVVGGGFTPLSVSVIIGIDGKL